MKYFIKVLEKIFSFDSIGFFDIFFVDLNDGGKSINDKFLEKCAVGDGISMRFDDDDFEITQVLQFGNLKKGHDVAFLEFQNLEFS